MVVEMIAMYYAGKRTHQGKPSGMISREGARDLVETGLADWTNKKCKSIKLKRRRADYLRPQPSQVMGKAVIEAYAARKAWARALLGEFAA